MKKVPWVIAFLLLCFLVLGYQKYVKIEALANQSDAHHEQATKDRDAARRALNTKTEELQALSSKYEQEINACSKEAKSFVIKEEHARNFLESLNHLRGLTVKEIQVLLSYDMVHKWKDKHTKSIGKTIGEILQVAEPEYDEYKKSFEKEVQEMRKRDAKNFVVTERNRTKFFDEIMDMNGLTVGESVSVFTYYMGHMMKDKNKSAVGKTVAEILVIAKKESEDMERERANKVADE